MLKSDQTHQSFKYLSFLCGEKYSTHFLAFKNICYIAVTYDYLTAQ